MNFPSIGGRLLGTALAVSLLMVSATDSHAQSGCDAPRDVFLNPFDKDSAHHRPIGTGAEYASDNHPATRDWLRANRFAINVGGPWGVDVAAVTSSDRTYTVDQIGGSGGYGLPKQVRFPPGGLVTTLGRNSAGTTDGVAVIYDRSENTAHQLRNFDWNNGNPRALQYREWNIRGLGHGTGAGQRIGTSASGVAALFGVLRGFEINTPGHEIGHSLQIALPRFANCNAMLSRNVILPATSTDGNARSGSNNLGNIPYGGLMALPSSVNIDSLGLSEPGRRLARAIQNYGVYVVDGGGCSAGAIRADQDVRGDIRNQLVKNDVPKIYRNMRLVLNSEWRPGQAAAGGGQPIAPNCAYNAGATNVATPSTAQSSSRSAQSSSQSASASGQPSADNSASPNQASRGQSTGGNAEPQPGTQAARDWAQAIKFWNWAQSALPNMRRFAPGTSQHDRAKTNYERNINNYVRFAEKAGVRVDQGTSPEQAFRQSRADASAGAALPATGSVRPPSEQQAASGGGSDTTSGNVRPKAGTPAARDWAQAIKFWNWAQSALPNMKRYARGTAGYDRAKTNYERNIRNYIQWAARAGVQVTAETPPDAVFG